MSLQGVLQQFIEDSWDEDDVWITVKQRKFLVANDAMDSYKDMYFSDLVDRYQGSCNSIMQKDEKFLEEFDLFQELDNIQFECQSCGWWYETCELGESESGEMICEDCVEEKK